MTDLPVSPPVAISTRAPGILVLVVGAPSETVPDREKPVGVAGVGVGVGVGVGALGELLPQAMKLRISVAIAKAASGRLMNRISKQIKGVKRTTCA